MRRGYVGGGGWWGTGGYWCWVTWRVLCGDGGGGKLVDVRWAVYMGST